MKIRYYLRGLGIGILGTALIFMLCGNSKQTMSDEMIIERAKELGMTESTVLADIGNSEVESEVPESTVTESTEDTVTETTEEIVSEESDETIEDTENVAVESEEVTVEETSVFEEESKQPVDTSEETESISPNESGDAEIAEETPVGQIISIMVNKGDGSDTVSHRLYEAGLVEDPYEYDKYLMQNGYDRRISAGEHLIPSGSGWQDIAQILCH